MTGYFITGTGTGVGKTYLTTALCWQLRKQAKQVVALKPIITGFDANDLHSDSALILRSLGESVDEHSLAAVSPWQFAAPLAPNMAAELEQREINLGNVVTFCRQVEEQVETLLVEGAGGVMSPITHDATMLDLMAALKYKVLLVAGSYLGSLSHTLTALMALQSRGLDVAAVIVSESEGSNVTLQATHDRLRKMIEPSIGVGVLSRVFRSDEPWTQTPDLLAVLT